MELAQLISRQVCARAAILGLMTLWAAVSPAGAADTYSEESVKAAYLYRFAVYVNWPDQAPSDVPFTIAVLGSPGVARELRHLVPGHLINNRPVQIRELTNAGDLGRPQILYVGAGHAESLRGVVSPAGLPSTLLVNIPMHTAKSFS